MDVSNMAPPNEAWHRLYATAIAVTNHVWEGLIEDEAFKQAEDLGDWAETIHTLMSFAPRTDETIMREERERVAQIVKDFRDIRGLPEEGGE